jgi:hypothetical protein
MSQLPIPKLTYKHIVKDDKHQIIVYDSYGSVLVSYADNTLQKAYDGVCEYVKLKIEDLLRDSNPPFMRLNLKPCDKKGDGRLPILQEQWRAMTLSDWLNGHLGVITQAELARIRGVSRQAVHQSTQRGDTEIFVWKDEKYVPFDTIFVSPEAVEHYGQPMVLYYATHKDRKKPRRRNNVKPKNAE